MNTKLRPVTYRIALCKPWLSAGPLLRTQSMPTKSGQLQINSPVDGQSATCLNLRIIDLTARQALQKAPASPGRLRAEFSLGAEIEL